MRRLDERSGVAGRGTLTRGALVARYDISHPAPTQWIAIGVVSTADDSFETRRPHRMVVGAGRSEAAAVEALAARLAQIEPEQAMVVPERRVPVPAGATDVRAMEAPGGP